MGDHAYSIVYGALRTSVSCFVVGLRRGGDIHGVLKSVVELARSTHVSSEQRCYHDRREVNGSKRRVRGRPFLA